MPKLFRVAAFCTVISPASAMTARLGHDGGNANGSRASLSQLAEIEEKTRSWGYAVFARRDDLSGDRVLTQAVASAAVGVSLEGHTFYFGVGAHFVSEQLRLRPAEAPQMLPALSFSWQHSSFQTSAVATQKFTRTSLSILLHAGVPVEIATEFEAVASQPYRWSAGLLFYLSKYGGLTLGYEPLARIPRLGLWLKPLAGLQCNALARVAPAETYAEFSVSFAFDITRNNDKLAQAVSDSAQLARPARRAKPAANVPAFATLVKWGLTPVAALRYTKEKDICKLDEPSRAALARHNWTCHDAE